MSKKERIFWACVQLAMIPIGGTIGLFIALAVLS